MIGDPTTKDVVATTAADELQTLGGKNHQRVYDPEVTGLLREILTEAKKQTLYLSILAGEENGS